MKTLAEHADAFVPQKRLVVTRTIAEPEMCVVIIDHPGVAMSSLLIHEKDLKQLAMSILVATGSITGMLAERVEATVRQRDTVPAMPSEVSENGIVTDARAAARAFFGDLGEQPA